jgi:threonyl-tRNA synthetase
LRQLGSERQQVLTLAALVEKLQRDALPPDLAIAAEVEAQG